MRCTFFFILLTQWTISNALSKSEYFFVEGCNIRNSRGIPQLILPGDYCLFLEDGTFFSSTSKKLRAFNKNKSLLWEIEGVFFRISFTADKKSILAITSKNILKISLRGKVISQREMVLPDAFALTLYENPDGTIILSGPSVGVVILSSDLIQVINEIRIPNVVSSHLHDAQLLDQKQILFFNNQVKSSKSDSDYSAIQIFDQKASKIIFSFGPKPREFFYSSFGGGVDIVNSDLLLITHPSTGIFLYSKKRKDIVFSTLEVHRSLSLFSINYIQKVRLLDLHGFLKTWEVIARKPVELP